MATNENEVESWLEIILKNENIENLSVNISGNSEKGDGFMGDIVFVEANGVTNNGEKKTYSLVLKCAKRSRMLRENSPVKEAYLNEMVFYDKILPSFLQFQSERNVDDPFNKVPKCYGTLIQGEMEIVALENLKKKGYFLWDKKEPLTRKQIDLVIEEYGKLHAVSIAMKEQDPEKFKKLSEGTYDILTRFMELTKMIAGFEENIEEIYNVLKDDLDETILLKWRGLKNQVESFYKKISRPMEGMNVIIHGDCWINNFMHYFIDNQPSSIVLLDWQLTKFSSPIFDLSYFLFACVSKEDINDVDTILKHYHSTLSNHLRKLGSNADELYPLDQFLGEWKKYAKYGIILVTTIHKTTVTDKEAVPDLVQAAENGEDVLAAFNLPTKDVEGFRKRMHYIVKYVAEHNLV